jgi:hypothetical protein
MYAGLLVVVGSGLMMSGGNDAMKEVHEAAVYSLLAVAGVHVAGVIVHTVRMRDNITLSMITGRKDTAEQAAIGSSAPVAALVMLAILLMLGGGLLRNYDAANKRTVLPLVGTSIALGDADYDSAKAARQHRGDDDQRGHADD